MLERARAAAIEQATDLLLRPTDTDDGGPGGGPGDVAAAAAAVGGRLARIGSLPGVVVDPTARTATVQLPPGPGAGGVPAGGPSLAGVTDGSPLLGGVTGGSPSLAAAADYDCDCDDEPIVVVDLSPLTAVGAHNADNAGVVGLYKLNSVATHSLKAPGLNH
jgi:hypothetical protein